MDQDNNKNFWDLLRLSGLAMVLGGTILTLGVGLRTPLQPRPAIASYTLPETVPLKGWQPISQSTLPEPADEKLVPLASLAYRYQREEMSLTIEMRYLTATKGDVTQFIRWYTEIPGDTEMKVYQQPDQGSYVFFIHQDRAYLSSCLHPQGQITATGTEYLWTKVISGVSSGQFIGWLTGKNTIFDQRCLWFHLSLPLESSADNEESHRILIETWVLWHDWWTKNFPM